jgi:putative membrane protein
LYNALVDQTEKTESTILSIVIKKLATLFGLENSYKTIEELLNNLGTFKDTIEQPIMTQKAFIENADKSISKNSSVFLGATTINELPNRLKIFFNQKLLGGLSKDDLLKIEIQGQKNGLYGIGLGIFFLVIGL